MAGAHFEFLHDLIVFVLMMASSPASLSAAYANAPSCVSVGLTMPLISDRYRCGSRAATRQCSNREAFQHAPTVCIEDGDFMCAKARYVHLRAIRQTLKPCGSKKPAIR